MVRPPHHMFIRTGNYMSPYPYRDPATFTTVDSVLVEIDNILQHLEYHAGALDDFEHESDQLIWYGEQVDWLKLYYERAERLMVHESQLNRPL